MLLGITDDLDLRIRLCDGHLYIEVLGPLNDDAGEGFGSVVEPVARHFHGGQIHVDCRAGTIGGVGGVECLLRLSLAARPGGRVELRDLPDGAVALLRSSGVAGEFALTGACRTS